VKDKSIALILGGPEGDDESPGGALGMALKSLAKAMKAEDWTRAEDAFREAVAACDDEGESDDEKESDDSDSDDDDLIL
jgi:hypothetical protein